MIELSPANIEAYLHDAGRLPGDVTAHAELLGWGVSNVVMRVSPSDGDDFVVKQSREQLRTEAAWFSRLDRVWREADVMKVLGDILPSGAVPHVLFEDRENYVFGMEAVDSAHIVWKKSLLQGEFNPTVTTTAADYLAAIHRETANDESLARRFGDRTVFRELRVDPFYRTVADVHGKLRARIDTLIDEMAENAACLVLGDFSPKNILVTPRCQGRDKGGVTLVDFETGHYGDPAFDLGFFLSHILLKAFYHAPKRHEPLLELAETFWNRYVVGLGVPASIDAFEQRGLGRRTAGHLAACTLARIDGTSRVDYLDEARRDAARLAAISALSDEAFVNPIDTMRFVGCCAEDL